MRRNKSRRRDTVDAARAPTLTFFPSGAERWARREGNGGGAVRKRADRRGRSPSTTEEQNNKTREVDKKDKIINKPGRPEHGEVGTSANQRKNGKITSKRENGSARTARPRYILRGRRRVLRYIPGKPSDISTFPQRRGRQEQVLLGTPLSEKTLNEAPAKVATLGASSSTVSKDP